MPPLQLPPGNTQNPAFVVEYLLQLLCGKSHHIHHINLNAGINVSAARLHDRSLKWRHAHAGVHGEAVFDGAERYAPVEVNGYQVAGGGWFAELCCSPPRKI